MDRPHTCLSWMLPVPWVGGLKRAGTRAESGVGEHFTTKSPLIRLPDSYIASYLSNRHAKESMLKVQQRQHNPPTSPSSTATSSLLADSPYPKKHKLHQANQLRLAHQEFHRQRELYNRNQQQEQLQAHLRVLQQHYLQPSSSSSSSYHYHAIPSLPEPGNSFQPQPHPSNNPIPNSSSVYPILENLSASSTTAPAFTYPSPASTSPPSSSSSSTSSSPIPTPPTSSSPSSFSSFAFHASIPLDLPGSSNVGFRASQALMREKERTRIQSIRDTLPMVPLPREVARENLRQFSQRLQRRRARARDTILLDLHHGVKTVEAQVQRQVEMVMSRLREAPGSRYAFAITNTFLAQIPSSLTGSLLQTTTTTTTAAGASSSSSSSSSSPSSSSLTSPDGRERDIKVEESLSIELDSIALDASPRTPSSPSPSLSSASSSASSPKANPVLVKQEQLDPPVSLSSTGASEVLSASMRADYSTACSQVLSAALPSFIPTMVAPLVCVFSYPVPPNGSAAATGPYQQHKDVVFPWGLPDRPQATTSLSSVEEPFPVPDPGIILVRSNAWTQAEREALYLAATRFRLSGQWSKIREMMNLHRTDKEIEAEYMKLYGHRDDAENDDHDDDDDDDDDVDDHDHDNDPFQRRQRQRRYPCGHGHGHDDETCSQLLDKDRAAAAAAAKMQEDRFGSMDGDADDEAEPAVFMRFGGGGGRRSQWHQQQQQGPQSASAVSASGYERPRVLDQPREPIRLHKKELMIDKRFMLEEIPMRL
ncbi:hypothetical protein B0O80DRAFT_430826 [Mortierella sp. GBAus27b]|nr:hypothetical protein B0O80DRAFT_430826 [Mortierella sp. GBAus27b]